jgi:hypothetical protein
MSEAAYALAGTVLGSLGGFLVAWLNIKAQHQRAEDDALVRTCSNFAARIRRVRQLSMAIEQNGLREKWWDEAQQLIGEAEGDYEHLRLISDFPATQEAARWSVHHAYWLVRAASKMEYDNKPIPWGEHHDSLKEWVTKFHICSRREIGKKKPADIFVDRVGGGPSFYSTAQPQSIADSRKGMTK